MTTEPLTIESLARAIHEDSAKALMTVTGNLACWGEDMHIYRDFDQEDETIKECRREQARLMLERIMR